MVSALQLLPYKSGACGIILKRDKRNMKKIVTLKQKILVVD